MKEYVLNYYPEFECIAEKCQHTCCAGWEMCIDKESLDRYKNDKSTFLQSLNSGINFRKSKFKSDRLGRCAFLNDSGLCEIIINLGKDSLCQVCRDHPRYRSFFDDRTEMGLGFCCEQATKIILSYKNKIEPILVNDDGKLEELSFNDNNVLEFREKVLSILQDRTKSINCRIEEILALCKANILGLNFKKIVKTFMSFERLDKKWTARLKGIKDKSFTINTAEKLSIFCEQFLVNELYRHLSSSEDTIWVRARTIACIFAWWIIKIIFEDESAENSNDERLFDVVRMYSAEVEYSKKNLDKLFAVAYRFVHL